jgi:hypothetical protein
MNREKLELIGAGADPSLRDEMSCREPRDYNRPKK